MIAILQSLVPHYREEFFRGINKNTKCDIFIYDYGNDDEFSMSNIEVLPIKRLYSKPFLIYSLRPLLSKKYDTLILMWHFGHLSTWLLLLTKPIHRKKIILMGQGISVKRYLKEEQKPNILLKFMAKFADVLWVYMEKEREQWIKIFPHKNIVALKNTISGIDKILKQPNTKKNTNFKEEIILIFCARFTTPFRRSDLLLKVIEQLDSTKFGFIIIGDGPYKPNFSGFDNVYDYGSVYNDDIKRELFDQADIYFQPGWLGLSVVEAMAYGKPIFTFKRQDDILQCVEYSYIKNNYNGIIFDDIESMKQKINVIQKDEIEELGRNARKYAKENLLITSMVERATNSF